MKNVYLQAIGIGVIAGMRSMSAPAFVSNYLAKEQSIEIENSAFRLLASRNVANALKVLAVSEMIADKLPIIPDRISPTPLLGRAISGAICGASMCISKGERSDIGGISGGLAAIVSAYGFYYLRRKLSEDAGIPNVLLGLIEDAVVIKGGLSILDEV